MILHSVDIYDNNYICCVLTGQSDRLYTISLSYDDDMVHFECTCPHFTYRKKNCKHIYWFTRSYIKKRVIEQINCQDIDTFICKYFDIYDLQKLRNDTCPICFEPIGNSTLTLCCKQCQNGYHSICFKRYIYTDFYLWSPTSCILCRSNIVFN
jgi:hypothetical protein